VPPGLERARSKGLGQKELGSKEWGWRVSASRVLASRVQGWKELGSASAWSAWPQRCSPGQKRWPGWSSAPEVEWWQTGLPAWRPPLAGAER